MMFQALDLPDGSGEQKVGHCCPPCWNIDNGEGLENYNRAKQDKRLADVFKSIKSTTAKEDYVRNLRYPKLLYFLVDIKINAD